MYKVTIQLFGHAADHCTVHGITPEGKEGAGHYPWKLQNKNSYVDALATFLNVKDTALSLQKNNGCLELTGAYDETRKEQILKDTMDGYILEHINRRLSEYAHNYPSDYIGKLSKVKIHEMVFFPADEMENLKKMAQQEMEQILKYGIAPVQVLTPNAEEPREPEISSQLSVGSLNEDVAQGTGQVVEGKNVQLNAEVERQMSTSSAGSSSGLKRQTSSGLVMRRDDENPEVPEFTLAHLFEFDAGKVNDLLKDEKFDEASKMLEIRYNRPEVAAISECIKYYTALSYLRESSLREYEKAVEVRNKISSFIQDKMQADATEVLQMAKSYPKETFLLYQIAAKLFETKSADECVKGLKDCIWGMKELAENLMKSSAGKRLVANHVIRFMQGVPNTIVSNNDAEEHLRTLQAASAYYCLYYVAQSSQDWDVCNSILGKGVDNMEATFVEKAKEHKVYSQLLANDGNCLKGLKRYDEARACFEKARDAIEAAEDISEPRRNELVKKYEGFFHGVPRQ